MSYVKRDNDGNIIGFSRNEIPVERATNENETGWELCTDQEEINAFLNNEQ